MAKLGIVLPAYQDAVWSYVKAQRDGDKFYIGDHVGQDDNAVTVRGKVGEVGTDAAAEVTPEEAEKLVRNIFLTTTASRSRTHTRAHQPTLVHATRRLAMPDFVCCRRLATISMETWTAWIKSSSW